MIGSKKVSITLKSDQLKTMSDIYEIGGIEWQVFPQAADHPNYLVLVCNQQCKNLWYCEAKIDVTAAYNHYHNEKASLALKQCFNSYNQFNIRLVYNIGDYEHVTIDIEVLWSANNLPFLDAELEVECNGKSALVPVNQQFLAFHSNYFRNLFFGDWEEQKKHLLGDPEDIRMPKIKEEDSNFNLTAFKYMLNGMHVLGPQLTKLPFPNWANKDQETKMALLKLSVKYQLPVLTEFAGNALIALGTDVTELLGAADDLGLDWVKQQCLENVDAKDYCENIVKNFPIHSRMQEETRQQFEAKLAESAKQLSRSSDAAVARTSTVVISYDLQEDE